MIRSYKWSACSQPGSPSARAQARSSTLRRALRLAAVLYGLGLLWPAAVAHAQGGDFGVKKGKSGKAGASDQGLDRATPTDDLNEVNSAASPNGSADGNAPSNNSSPATEDAALFDVNSQGAAAKNAPANNTLFNAAPSNAGGKGAANNASSSFGSEGASPNAGTNPAAANAQGATDAAAVTTAPVTTAPVTTSPLTTAPAVAPPANGAANTPAGTTTGSNAANANAPNNESNNLNSAADPLEADAPAGVLAPPKVAPPLPPPNEYGGAPPLPGTLRLMADGEAPQEYLVEPGDTLYDICDQLLDEAAYWPKLWALNPEIKNPHFIFPNMRLRFYPGDDDTPPYLQVVTEDDVIPIDKGTLEEEQLVAEKVNFPADQVQDYVTEVIGPEQVDALQDDIFTAGRVFHASDMLLQVPGFIYAEEKPALAKVVSGREGGENVAAGGKVFVEASGGLTPGTLYSILRRGEAIDNPETGDHVGIKYYFVANLRVQKALADQNFAGTVQDNQLGVWPGDVVVNYVSTRRVVPANDQVGAVSAASAHIVGWQYAGQETGGRGGFAFIDKGTSGGIAPGSYLPIYATPGYLTVSSGDMGLPIDYEKVGVMRIIDVTEAGACGYVVRSREQLRIGDRTDKGS